MFVSVSVIQLRATPFASTLALKDANSTGTGASVDSILIAVNPPRGFTVLAPLGQTPSASVPTNGKIEPSANNLLSTLLTPFANTLGIILPQAPVNWSTLSL